MHKQPLVSVIIPCYNQGIYLPDALQSVLDQDYSSWECIIVDDGSQDNTSAIAAEWCRKDSRFYSINICNSGLATARNAGISMADGKFILPLDADDRIGAEYISRAIAVFENDPAVKLVYCRAELFGEETGEWALNDFSLEVLKDGNMLFCSTLYRKEDFIRAGKYDPSMRFGWEDWELWISMLKSGGSVVRLDYFGFFYRIRKDSMLRKMSDKQGNKMKKYIAGKHAGFIFSEGGSGKYIHRARYSLNRILGYFMIPRRKKTLFAGNAVKQ